MKHILIGHRGVPSAAPENTLSSFKMAEKIGVPWIECDVEVLGDGTVVLSHDATLDRCTDHTGLLADLKKSDLTTIDAGSWFGNEFNGERIPSLEDFIGYINTTRLSVNLEIKSCADTALTQMLIDGVIAQLKKQWEKDRPLLVSSFHHDVLMTLKKQMPDILVACLFEQQDTEQHWIKNMEQTEATIIHPKNEGLTQQQILAMKARGYKINVWTVNNLNRAKELYDWGVDGIFTDIPQHFPMYYHQ
ncbi:Glycerophosphodiester phosphodiesterase, cytoplasmic [invertebrate metagenome]|uniref:Glycerophosphodiester phosphodiesterase, cytoplasmic n=1 Tax=invertebrate metagenome TaxID=1711999 RepID=A0A2H9TAJ1_9ZZZZ